jgi:hypothetical protein
MPFRQTTATTTAQQVVAYNSKRTALSIRVASGNPVYISNDITDVTGSGWPLASGDFISFLASDGDDATAAVYAQTAALTGDLRIQESYGGVPKEA